MKKVFTIILVVSISFFKSYAQEKEEVFYQKDLSIPVNKKKNTAIILTAEQLSQVKKYEKSYYQKKTAIEKNTKLTSQQKKSRLENLDKEKDQKLKAILTPEQKEKMKQLKNNTPRRGVTNMPNERTSR